VGRDPLAARRTRIHPEPVAARDRHFGSHHFACAMESKLTQISFHRVRDAHPMPARPRAMRVRVVGSGALSVCPLNVKAALNGPWWVTSVPILSQSGASAPGPSVRIQLCRSGVNGVPGGTIGLGADSHRKSPALPRLTSGRKNRSHPHSSGSIPHGGVSSRVATLPSTSVAVADTTVQGEPKHENGVLNGGTPPVPLLLGLRIMR